MLLCTKSVYWDECEQNTCSYNFHHICFIVGWPACKPAWCRKLLLQNLSTLLYFSSDKSFLLHSFCRLWYVPKWVSLKELEIEKIKDLKIGIGIKKKQRNKAEDGGIIL